MRKLERVLKKLFLKLRKTDLDHNAPKMRKIREKTVMRKNIYLNNLKQKLYIHNIYVNV